MLTNSLEIAKEFWHCSLIKTNTFLVLPAQHKQKLILPLLRAHNEITYLGWVAEVVTQ